MTNLNVSICICAYNEERNIKELLRILVKQYQKNIKIIEILVYSDGSTDNTVESAGNVKDARIHIIANSKRQGKAFGLNLLFRKSKGDVIVLFDADMLPATLYTVENIAKPFFDSSFQGLAGGRRKATSSRFLTGIGLSNLFLSYDIVREKLNQGENLYCFLAGVTALHRNFFHSLTLPLDSPCDDNHIYLEAKKGNFPLEYVPSAYVWFTPPQTGSDQIKQGARYLASEAILSRYFDSKFVKREFFIPFSLRLQVFIYQVFKNPIAYLWVKYLSLRCYYKSSNLASRLGGVWNVVDSTKKNHI